MRRERTCVEGENVSEGRERAWRERVMVEALDGEEEGVEMSGVRYTNLRYADVIVLVAETTEDLQRMMHKVEDQCMRYKLEIIKDKTKSLKIGRERERRPEHTTEYWSD